MLVLRVLIKFRRILSRHQKVRILELALLMMLGGFLEMLSVSLLMPFINAVMNPDEIMNIVFIRKLCGFLGINSARTFLMLMAMALAGVYILKNLFLLFQMNIQHRFVYNNMFATQERLLHNYLARPYEYFLGISSGEVLRIIGNDTRDTFSLLMSVLFLCSELTVSLILIVTIFVIAPGMTLGMAVLLAVMVAVILKILRPVLRKAGTENQKAFASMNKWLLQAIQGIKELKIMHREPFFEQNFSKSGKIYVKSTYLSQTLALVPRFMIEALAMGSFFIMAAVLIYRGVSFDSLIPMLSAVAMAAVRLLPSANRISQSMADIAFREPMLDKMIENLQEASGYSQKKGETAQKQADKWKDAIKMDSVSYRYPGNEKPVLEHASMNIKKGTSVGIAGASGAGKTTAMDILLGLLKPESGRVLADGKDIELDMEGWQSQAGYIPQSIFLLDGNIRENVAFGVECEKIDDGRVWNALKEAALEDFVKSLPQGLLTELGERGVRLSGGQRQRIGIARALYANPSVLFFDEATSALDQETEAAIMESVYHLHGRKTMIMIAHRLSTIENCDEIYRVEDGKIIKEKP